MKLKTYGYEEDCIDPIVINNALDGTGTGKTMVYAVNDGDFAKMINREIDRIRSEGEIR